MAEHFKLEITNRSTKITTWTGVSDDFANEYKERLGVPTTSVTINVAENNFDAPSLSRLPSMFPTAMEPPQS